MMKTATRTMAVVNVAKPGRDLLVRITEPGRQTDPVAHYFVTAQKGDFGTVYAWESWEHPGKEAYTVDTSAMTCNCFWGRKGKGKACRHLEATRVMRRQGVLDGTV